MGIGSLDHSIGQRRLPDGVAIMFLDPDGDRGVGVMFQLVRQAEHTPVELDMFVCLIVAGAAPGAIGNFLVAAQSMLEQSQVPAR